MSTGADDRQAPGNEALATAARRETEFPDGTWWWHTEPDGRRVLYPLMTLEVLGEPPVTNATRFRCARCKVEGTSAELQQRDCVDENWYHGDVRTYRLTYDPMRCNSCGHQWVVRLWRGFAKRNCPKCTGISSERIR